MRTLRTRLAVGALAALTALTFAACGDSDSNVEAEDPTDEVSEEGGGGSGSDNAVSIEMKDYSYAVDGELSAGTATIELSNTGDEFHMAAMSPLKPGKTIDDVKTALEKEDEAAFEEIFAEELGAPGGFLSPGQENALTVTDLPAGKYALLCFIPTAEEGSPHFAKGMIGELEVGEAEDEEIETPEPDVTYTFEAGKVTGPKTLDAGEITIQAKGVGENHEFVVVEKNEPDATYEDLDKYFTELFEGEDPPPKDLSDAPGIIRTYAFDFPETRELFVKLDLEPGDYLIGCALEGGEEEGAKPHREILEVTVE